MERRIQGHNGWYSTQSEQTSPTSEEARARLPGSTIVR